MEDIFFDVLRTGLGRNIADARMLSENEWDNVYEIASKHKLLGLVYISAQTYIEMMKKQGLSESDVIPRQKYLKWLGVASVISRQNEKIDRNCKVVQDKFRNEGFCTCILKGQGVAKYYGALSSLRQSGDIDIWIWPKGDWTLNHDKRMKIVVEFLRTVLKCSPPTYHNIAFKLHDGTNVEVHYTPSWMFSPIHNRRLQKWIEAQAPTEMQNEFSTLEFNRIYILLHIYRHLFGEGIGLKQIVDYYFVLRYRKLTEDERQRAMGLLKSLGLGRFTAALMWILHNKLGLAEDYLLCKPNEKEGSFLLSEVLIAGNFGQYDKRINHSYDESKLSVFFMRISRNFHFITHYPSEVLWCPLWKVWHQLWLIKFRDKKSNCK